GGKTRRINSGSRSRSTSSASTCNQVIFYKNDDEDLWIRIWFVWFIWGTWIFVLSRLPSTTNVVTITTFRIVDEGEGSCIIKTLHSTSTSVSASLQIVRITNLKEEEKKKKKQRAR
ncbi:unnamed protein product, partial [Prunus brigantina]